MRATPWQRSLIGAAMVAGGVVFVLFGHVAGGAARGRRGAAALAHGSRRLASEPGAPGQARRGGGRDAHSTALSLIRIAESSGCGDTHHASIVCRRRSGPSRRRLGRARRMRRRHRRNEASHAATTSDPSSTGGASSATEARSPISQLDRPTEVAGVKGHVVQIATSNSDGYALTSTGAVYAWGVNSYGELGDGQLTPYETKAVEVDFPAGIKITSLPNPMPFDAGLAIDSTGHAWGWGLNGSDDLCLSGLVESRPQQLPLSDVTLATGARTHALFDSSGTVYACGSGDAGELGNGSTASTSTPTPVVGLPSGAKVTALTSSWEGSGALLANGDYYNWGYNAAGQLGNGSTANSAVPVKVDLAERRHTGVPGRERREERTDGRHPARRRRLGVGRQ